MSFKANFSRELSEYLGSPEHPKAWGVCCHSIPKVMLGSITVLSRAAHTWEAGAHGKRMQRFSYIFPLYFRG